MAKYSITTETPAVEAIEVLSLGDCNKQAYESDWESTGHRDWAAFANITESTRGLGALCNVLSADWSHARDVETNGDDVVSYQPLPQNVVHGLHCAQRALLNRLNGELEFVHSRASAAVNAGSAK